MRALFRVCWQVPRALFSILPALIGEVWRGRRFLYTVVEFPDETHNRERAMRKLAKFVVLDHVTTEEYMSCAAYIVAYYLGENVPKLSRAQVSRIISGRRRVRHSQRQGVSAL